MFQNVVAENISKLSSSKGKSRISAFTSTIGEKDLQKYNSDCSFF
jgi:hypothetical protein